MYRSSLSTPITSRFVTLFHNVSSFATAGHTGPDYHEDVSLRQKRVQT